jgi:hypothetical protein
LDIILVYGNFELTDKFSELFLIQKFSYNFNKWNFWNVVKMIDFEYYKGCIDIFDNIIKVKTILYKVGSMII